MKIFNSLSSRLTLLLAFILILSSANSCNTEKADKSNKADGILSSKKVFSLEYPRNNKKYLLGEAVPVSFSTKDSVLADSVMIFRNGELIYLEKERPNSFTTSALTEKAGLNTYRIRIHYPDSLSQNLSFQLKVFPEKEPEVYSYEVIRKLPHDENDYTQGYFYKDGFLYEGTGQRGQSRLIKLNPSNGNVLLEHKLKSEYFGEGITCVGNKIYQLTWLSRKGFVYDLRTFELLQEFDLKTQEGWGLTSNGSELILSDGSTRLYFYDPETFQEKEQLFVANDKGMVKNLNELEYVNGAVWANILNTPYLIKIDSETGAILGRLDLSDLFPKQMPRDGNHVLNGIAYNPDRNTWFVTGKYWPTAFEIRIHD